MEEEGGRGTAPACPTNPKGLPQRRPHQGLWEGTGSVAGCRAGPGHAQVPAGCHLLAAAAPAACPLRTAPRSSGARRR